MTRPLTEAVDHLLIGASSLEAGVSWLEERTGIRAAPGGSHPGLGTWNALASLGPGRYIEIIAPDPSQKDVPTFYIPGLREFETPRLATWAAKDEQLTTLSHRLEAPMGAVGSRSGSRVRPDGQRLQWTLAFPSHRDHGAFDGLLPFLIEWESEETHPSLSTPPGLSLASLTIEHPLAASLEAALGRLGIEATVTEAKTPRLGATIETPRGVVRL